MKYFYGFLLIFVLTNCGNNQETITKDQLQIRQGLFYKVNDQQPFTGFITSSYSNNQVMEYFSVKNGLYHGEYSSYFENGQLKSQGSFENGNGEVTHYDQDNTAKKINYYFENEIDPYEVIYVEEKKYLNLKEPDCKTFDLENCPAPKSLTSYYLNSEYRKGICEGAIHRCNAYTRYIEGLPTRITLNENTIDGWVMTIAGRIVHMTHLRGDAFEQSYYNFDEEELVWKSKRSMELIGDRLANFSYMSLFNDLRYESKGTISFEGDKVIINTVHSYEDDEYYNEEITEIYYEKSDISLTIINEKSSWRCIVYGDEPSEDLTYSNKAYPSGNLIEEKSNFSEFSSYLEEIGCLELLNEEEIRSYYKNFYDDLEEKERLQREKEEKERLQREKEEKEEIERLLTLEQLDLQREKEEKERLLIVEQFDLLREKEEKERLQREKEERRTSTEARYRAELSDWKEKERLQRENGSPKITITQGWRDGEYIPLFKVQPVYPRRAQERGTEGYVIVAFTITESGTIEDPYVIEGKCRSANNRGGEYNDCSMFNSASLRAASKLKYKPAIRDGRAVAVEDVPHKFTYLLDL